MRAALAILAACLFAGCGSAQSTGGVPNPDDPGLIVFDGALRPASPGAPVGSRHPLASYYALRPDGTGLRKLAFSHEEPDLSFSADGRFVAMSAFKGERSLIVVSRADGSERHVVPLLRDGLARSPSVSSDGKRVAFTFSLATGGALMGGPTELWTVSVDGKGLKQLSSTGDVMSVAWSPDGKRVAFLDGSQLADGSGGPVGDIYLINADGTDEHQIVRSYTGFGPGVAWSPDGKRIAFVNAEQKISVVDATGGTVEFVGPEGESPAWSPDGKRLAFLRVVTCRGYVACNRSRIFIVDLGGDSPREVGPKYGAPAMLAWTTANLQPSAQDSKVPPSS